MALIKKPYELTFQPKIKALIYGEPGTGKTTLALSAPNPLLIDCDGGFGDELLTCRLPLCELCRAGNDHMVIVLTADAIVVQIALGQLCTQKQTGLVCSVEKAGKEAALGRAVFQRDHTGMAHIGAGEGDTAAGNFRRSCMQLPA